jgi:hypothetical protein
MPLRVRDVLRLGLLIAAAVLCTGCELFTGPSKSVAGDWTSVSLFGGNPDRIDMSLSQSGDVISGVMCRAGREFLVYTNIPVSGDYPHVTFTVTQFGVTRSFAGKFEEDREQIAGNFGIPDDPRATPLRFNRTETGGHCEGAKPAP